MYNLSCLTNSCCDLHCRNSKLTQILRDCLGTIIDLEFSTKLNLELDSPSECLLDDKRHSLNAS